MAPAALRLTAIQVDSVISGKFHVKDFKTAKPERAASETFAELFYTLPPSPGGPNRMSGNKGMVHRVSNRRRDRLGVRRSAAGRE
jgi:hypothetical protein